MNYIYLTFLLILTTPAWATEPDYIDKLILAHKTDKLEDFIHYFGPPKKLALSLV